MTDKAVKFLADGSRAMWRVIWPILKEVSLEEAKELAKDLGKEIGEKITDHIIDTADKARDALTNLLNDNAPAGPSQVGVDTRVFPVSPSPATPAPAPASATPTPEVRLDVAPAPTTTTSVASGAASEIRAPDVAPAPTTTPPHVCIRARALPRFRFASRIGAPAQVQSTPAALKEATATESSSSSSSYMLLYLLGGVTVLVVVGGVIYKYNQRRHQDPEPTTDGTPGKTDNDPPATDGNDTDEQSTFLEPRETDIDGTTCKEESSKTEGVDAVSSEDLQDDRKKDAPKGNANDEDTSTEATRPGQTVVKPEEADEAPNNPAAGM